jgi:hypothetical protein
LPNALMYVDANGDPIDADFNETYFE